ncbi:MAG: hypothetical protein QOI91_1877 [Solirubrobacteraceae bacterium]|nr:hypothetical protein [Solirubrobacteraceae bacterium]
MRRPDWTAVTIALAGAVLLGWLGLREFAFNDYEYEALPAYTALSGGDLGAFLSALPAYGGSLILRAPAALVPDLWGGGALSVYRAAALPCLLAGVVLGLVLDARMREAGRGLAARRLALLVCVANPVTLLALQVGHPEELLGGALCVGAVLAASRDRAALSGLLLGLAVANKPWAVLAVAPVALVLPRRHLRAALVAAGTAGAVLAPMLLSIPAGTVEGATHTSGIFQPWQVWWPLGDTGQVVQGLQGAKPDGWRAAPVWLSPLSRPIILGAGALLFAAWAYAGRRRPRMPDALLALALAFLLRCLLDPWNTGYYALPFLLALVAWEVHARRGLPLLSAAATLAVWTTFDLLPRWLTPDVQAVSYLAWALPLAAALSLRLLAPDRFARLARPLSAAAGRHLPTLVRRPDARAA